jgi:hypothetical protein
MPIVPFTLSTQLRHHQRPDMRLVLLGISISSPGFLVLDGRGAMRTKPQSGFPVDNRVYLSHATRRDWSDWPYTS